eukprot:m.349281 g.349281  ORF g.349281 m.349281 type:complete len:123 (+) comp16150_c0_seq6:3492-3860(+)
MSDIGSIPVTHLGHTLTSNKTKSWRMSGNALVLETKERLFDWVSLAQYMLGVRCQIRERTPSHAKQPQTLEASLYQRHHKVGLFRSDKPIHQAYIVHPSAQMSCTRQEKKLHNANKGNNDKT